MKVFVIPTDEELVMAEDTEAILEDRFDLPTRMTYSFDSAGSASEDSTLAARRPL